MLEPNLIDVFGTFLVKVQKGGVVFGSGRAIPECLSAKKVTITEC